MERHARSAVHRVTVVNHCSIVIDRSPERTWAELEAEYGAGIGFARAGYKLEALNEPAFPLGGYRLWREQNGGIDERICRITEREASAMRISMRADYLSPDARNMTVFTTFQALRAGATAEFHLDCHSTFDLDVGANASRDDVARAVVQLGDHFDRGIAQGVSRLKARIEAASAAE
ncbi:hypothetical protein TQ38_019815 [Novosphingobium sp. P6W]|nr:hypothetical protein TQ38_019815 [Novosphingobium sp. P6W]KIS31799.1 hypothetical protein TQ38_15475 [Novosphingobium sp. P6W]